MKIKTKYNIGDKVAIEHDGGMSVMTIDGISIDRVADHPTEIRYSGVETIDRQLDIREDAISGIYSRADTPKSDTLANGVYILTKSKTLATVSELEADSTALGVVLITDHARIFIDKNEPKEMKWEEAMNFCASEPSYNGDPLRLPDTHEGQEIAFNHAKINEAMKLIGGDEIGERCYWANREYYSNRACIYYGYFGSVITGSKYGTLSVRPVSAFKR